MAIGTTAMLAMGSVAGGLIQGSAAKSASAAQTQLGYDALDLQRQQYETAMSQSAPWLEAGQTSLDAYLGELGLGPDTVDFQESEGYKFALDQGQKAMDRTAAARGNRLGGATMKEAARYATGLADQEYGTFLNRLAAGAGMGQTAVSQNAAIGQGYANAGGSILQGIGSAQASGYVGQSNAFTGAMSNVYGAYGAGMSGMFGPKPGLGITPSPAGLAAYGW